MNSTQLAILWIVGAVVVGVTVLYALVALLGSMFQSAPDPDDEGLVARARAIRPPATSFGRVDRDFTDMVRGTLFDVTTERAIEFMLLAGAILALAGYLLTDEWTVAAGGFVVGLVLVVMFFALFQNRRRRALQEQLPDGCFQLARGMRAGLALPAAVKESSQYSPPPLAGVFVSCHNRMGMGQSSGEAFEREAQDVRLTDFDLLAAIVGLHEEVGGNLPALLDRLAADIRSRNQYRGYYRATTALSRATTTFVALAAPIAVVLYLLFNPTLFMNFLATPLGWYLMAAACVLWIVGVAWSMWLLRKSDEY